MNNLPFVILAGGVGKRMGGEDPKQYILLGGRSILYQTFKRAFELGFRIFLVVRDPKYQKLIEKELSEFDCNIVYVDNGKERVDSVRNAVEFLRRDFKYAYIHDGVRPFFSKDIVEGEYWKREKYFCIVPGSSPKNTIKCIDLLGRVIKTLPRESLVEVGTPQLINIREYLKSDFSKISTDEGSVFEEMGLDVLVIPNNIENIKITTREDLFLGEQILKEKRY